MKLLLHHPGYFLQILGTVALCAMSITGTAYAGDVEALYRAAGDGKTTEVTGLLRSGVNVNGRTRSGSYALNAAAVENNTEVIQILLAHGADPNVRNRQGDTPLICATKYAGGRSDTVKLLVDAGTDREIRDNSGNTALDYAMAKKQKDAVSILGRSDS